MAEQLTFDLPVRTALGREDFFVSDANHLAVARLDAVAGWPNHKLALIGPEGAGKSHLAQMWASAQEGRVVDARDINEAAIPSIDEPYAVEVSEHLSPDEQTTLFHLHNHMQHARLPLLFVARTPPARWPLTLPDLQSRMAATDVAEIAAPDDALLAAVLVKLFTDRQLSVSASLVPWLIARTERSFAAINRLVSALDTAALSEARAVNRTLARDVLARLDKEL